MSLRHLSDLCTHAAHSIMFKTESANQACHVMSAWIFSKPWKDAGITECICQVLCIYCLPRCFPSLWHF